tara:strand:+ start:707 stop:988 length:282 start_codon:yes stop_codon:yes gene_type:complete
MSDYWSELFLGIIILSFATIGFMTFLNFIIGRYDQITIMLNESNSFGKICFISFITLITIPPFNLILNQNWYYTLIYGFLIFFGLGFMIFKKS